MRVGFLLFCVLSSALGSSGRKRATTPTTPTTPTTRPTTTKAPETETDPPPTEGGPTEEPEEIKDNVCERVPCHFNFGACSWHQRPGKQFTLFHANEVAGGRDTGVNALLLLGRRQYPDVSGSSYMAVNLNPGETVVMSVRELEVGIAFDLAIKIYEATDQCITRICIDGKCNKLTDHSVRASDRSWRELTFGPISPGVKTIDIVADNSAGLYFCSVGVKDIEVDGCDDQDYY